MSETRLAKLMGGLFGRGQDKQIEHFLAGSENTTTTPQLTPQEAEIVRTMHLDLDDAADRATFDKVLGAQQIRIVHTPREQKNRPVDSVDMNKPIETTSYVSPKKPKASGY